MKRFTHDSRSSAPFARRARFLMPGAWLALLLAVFLTGCDSSALVGLQPDDATPQTRLSTATGQTSIQSVNGSGTTSTPLLAGQNIEVGTVSVELVNDGADLKVTYQITDSDWCLTETHLEVAASLDAIPQTKKNNPIPGQFTYSDTHACTDMAMYTVPVPEGFGTDLTMLWIAAHAVVASNPPVFDGEVKVFGVERGSGDIYLIDVVGGTAALFFDVDDPEPDNDNSPNGLAYDETTKRVYFSAFGTDGDATPTSTLYYVESGSQENAGSVPGAVAGATFYNGEYYYFKNASDDLVKVQFNLVDGTVAAVVPICTDFTNNASSFRFGDIVIKDGVLYGSTNGPLENYFKLTLDGCAYTELNTTDGARLQLAFGSDDNLYGQSTATGEFFTVDLATGTTASLGVPTGAQDSFTDLAAGPKPITETAWGQGTRFTEKGSWGMYFKVTYCECQAEGLLYGVERESANINGGLYAIDVVGGSATLLFDTNLQGGAYTGNSPNGLGFDPENDRLYYMAVNESNPKSDLYVWDAVNGQQAVGLSLNQVVVGAAFYAGSYYYIPNSTAELWKVDVIFDGSGFVTGYTPTQVYSDFNGSHPSVYRFGDIAISQDGILYGSSNGTSGSTAEFFSVDLNDDTFSLISDSPGDALGLQLSFGSNGILYAHNAGTGEFFEVDVSSGAVTSTGTVTGSATLFSDLGSGTLCQPIVISP